MTFNAMPYDIIRHILVGTRENVIENYDFDSQLNIVYT